ISPLRRPGESPNHERCTCSSAVRIGCGPARSPGRPEEETVARRISQERAETIVRQFYRLEEYFGRQGVSRRQLLRLIAQGSAAATVLPVLVACGAASDNDVAEATAPAGGSTTATSVPGSPTTGGTQPPSGSGSRGGTIIIGTLGEAQTINPLLVNETEGTW